MDVVVLNYNDAETTIKFVESIHFFSCIGKILVVDNCSVDDSLDRISKIVTDKIVLTKTDYNGGYGYGNNFGIRYLCENYKSEYILLSNPDVVVQEDDLIELEKFLKNNRDYSIAAPFMRNAKGQKVDYTAFRLPTKKEYIMSINWLLKYFTHNRYKGLVCETKTVKDVDVVAGSLFLMNATDMLKYGMFDERVFLYCEEVVLGLKLKAKERKVALLTNLSFIHNHSVSINKTYSSVVAKQKIYMKSKLYVIKEYYKANLIERFIAFCLAKLSLIDVVVVPYIEPFLRKIKG